MAFFDDKQIDKNEIIARYISRVVSQSTPTYTSVPHSYFPSSLIGPALANPSAGSLGNEINAADLVNLLTTHAYNLSRYRRATWRILGNASPAGVYGTNVVSRLNNSYRSNLAQFNAAAPNNNITSEAEVLSQTMEDYIEELRNVYISARDNTVTIQVCHGSCHSSCHGSCHGSRGRR